MKKIIFLVICIFFLCNITYAASEKEMFQQGVEMLQQNKYQEAVELFTLSIHLSPDNAKAYKNRGVAYMKQKKYDLAIKDFEKAIDINPGLQGLYSNLGAVWYTKNNFKKAIFYYDKEILQNSSNHLFYFNRALAKAELKDFEKAIEDLASSLKINPDFYHGLCFKGDLLVKTGQLNDAKENYEKALEKNPEKKYARTQLNNLKKITKTKEVIAKKLYTVQVGAFLVKNNADKIIKRLSNKGYNARVFKSKTSDDKTLHIVRSGKFANKKEAQKLKKSIKDRMNINGIIKIAGKL